MAEKDTVSMATVKPDYAASDVYSTASEAPPAYKRQANSVKIAKITAFTIIVSSFVLGSFILASSYLQAKASCDQVQALDSVLEKELMLETLQQVSKELPRAEALLGKDNGEDLDLQNLDSKPAIKQTSSRNQHSEDESNDNTYSEEAEEMTKFPGKVPLELDLSDLAAALLQNNKKSRMNCVVERKHAEEIVDSPSKSVTLPFGMNLQTDPKKARITGERISIFCDSGDDSKEKEEAGRNNREEDEDSDEDVESMRPMFIPYQRLPIPFGAIPQQFPLTHMPQRMLPLPMQTHHQHQQQQQQQQGQGELPIIRQLPPPFQHLPMRAPQQVMQAPRPEPQTVRIHVQQIPFREIRVAEELPMQFAGLRPKQEQPEMPQFQVQRVPLRLALQRAGITADDLRNIQMMAENRITDELRRLSAEEAAESVENNSANNNSSEEDDSNDSQNSEQAQQQQSAQEGEQHAQQPEQHEMPEMLQPRRLILQQLPQPSASMSPPPQQFGRISFGRSLADPIRIPVPMMQEQADMPQESQEVSSDRQPLRNPRSI